MHPSVVWRHPDRTRLGPRTRSRHAVEGVVILPHYCHGVSFPNDTSNLHFREMCHGPCFTPGSLSIDNSNRVLSKIRLQDGDVRVNQQTKEGRPHPSSDTGR